MRNDRTGDEWSTLLLEKGFRPSSFLTMTFDQKRHAVSVEASYWWWRMLVRYLNERVGGKLYRRKWGHSYFSYIVGTEFHKSGAVHLHALVDNYIDFNAAHAFWQARCGWLWIRVVDDREKSLRYVLKYVTKGDYKLSVWLQKRRRSVSHLIVAQDGSRSILRDRR